MARVNKKNKEIWKVEKNVFSLSSERNLFKLSSQGFFEEIVSPLFIGKEANIFSARTKDGGLIIIKIYRLENCNFNKMHEYIRPDPRYLDLKKGKRNVIFAWVEREYRNLLKARDAIRVPIPLARRDNIILMEYIGDDRPAPKAKDELPKNVKAFFDKTVNMMQKLYKAGLVHGDLSEYNILNLHGEPIFIDFSQSTMKDNPNAKEILERDVRNICRFFGKRISVDEAAVMKKIIKP